MISRSLLKRLPVASHAVAQWDSWRLWEAFAAGAAVIHFDFEEMGFLTGGPKPEPMKHYVPVSLSRPEAILPVLEDHERLRSIGEAGRQWALEHYSSQPIAERVLRRLGFSVPTPESPSGAVSSSEAASALEFA